MNTGDKFPLLVVKADPDNGWRGAIGHVIWSHGYHEDKESYLIRNCPLNRKVFELLSYYTWIGILEHDREDLFISDSFVDKLGIDNETMLSCLPKINDWMDAI